MDIKKEIAQEKNDLKDIFRRIKQRDFSGNTGLAVKNYLFSFLTTLVEKGGSLIFVIFLARLLKPELFGLYSLALSTIMIFVVFSNLGLSQTLVKFISSSENKEKSKSYFLYLLKFKIGLSLFVATLLVVFAKLISNFYYNKPEIYLALITGALYLIILGLTNFIAGIFQAVNDFRKVFYKESIVQLFRLFLVPFFVLISISFLSQEILIAFIFILLAFAYFIAGIFIFISAKKNLDFLKSNKKDLTKQEKKTINQFVLALSAMAVSSVFFGQIDIFILGRYVSSEYIGFYRAAYSLVTSLIPLIAFSGALFPLFSRLKSDQLKKGFNKSLKLTFLISIPLFILVYLLAPLLINFVYGNEYSFSINLLKIFSLLIVILPLISIYSSFLISQNKQNKVAIFLVISTIINIILNYIFILTFLPKGFGYAVYGVTIATVISKVVYLLFLVFGKNN